MSDITGIAWGLAFGMYLAALLPIYEWHREVMHTPLRKAWMITLTWPVAAYILAVLVLAIWCAAICRSLAPWSTWHPFVAWHPIMKKAEHRR